MKNIKIQYKKIKNFILFKDISYNLKGKYKKVKYGYDEYDINTKEIKKTSLHRINKPAIIIYRNNKISEVQYWRFGKLHRTQGPAIIVYDKNETINEEWYNEGNKLNDNEIEQLKKIIFRRKKSLKLLLKLKNKIKK